MPASPRFFNRVYDRGSRGLTLVVTVAEPDEDACIASARELAKRHAGVHAIAVHRDVAGGEVRRELGVYGSAPRLTG